MERIRILLIEDDKIDQMAFKRFVKDKNLSYDYTIAGSVSEVKKILDSQRFDIVITDFLLGDGTAFDVFDLIINTPTIITTGSGDEEVAVKAMKGGAYDYLIKDPELNYLKVLPVTVENAIKRRRAEKQFRMLSHAIMSINDGVYVTDMDDRIIFVNKAFCGTYGYREEDILGRHSRVLWKEESANEYIGLSKASRGGWKGEVYHRRKDGSEFPIFLSRSVIEDENGDGVAIVGVAHDITERKRAEEELQKAKEAAESANRAKSEFLANMSHEIRTPLNAIIGMTELAMDTELTPEQQGFLRVVQSSSEVLLGVINDILDFSKIEAGQMEIEEVGFNLRDLIEGVADILSVRAHSKGLELACYVEPGIPSWVIGDPARIRQVLVNLVGNAIKFTEKGEVSIKVERAEVDDREKMGLHFMVSDTGIGISKENQARIFEKFSQADSSMTRRFGGTGLGLSISRSLVELMEGGIWLESEEGRGSTFHFSLALRYEGRGEEKEKVEFAYPDFRDVSVLIVDDNETNRVILEKTLSAWGFKVREAASGIEALECLRGRDAKVDFVILDHQMPGMDGIEVARAIRDGPNLGDIKIIMLSSWGGMKSELVKGVGISESIAKPVKQSRLFDVLMRVLGFREDEQETTVVSGIKADRAIGSGRHIKILLVEDNTDNQNLVRKMLENAGHEVDISENGEAAVEAVRRAQYDLILMDVQMPVMDGFSATREIRGWERERNLERIPIIALTAHALVGYREECLQHGMDDYITKPLKKKVLLEIVSRYSSDHPSGK